jgi:DNA polymerase III alpha subunit
LQLPLTASGGALMHCAERKPLHDVLTAIRLIKPVSECGYELLPNSERRLRSIPDLHAVYGRDLMEETLSIAARCTFSHDELRYEYPAELVPAGHTPSTWLRVLTYEGVKDRWPQGASDETLALIEHELAQRVEEAALRIRLQRLAHGCQDDFSKRSHAGRAVSEATAIRSISRLRHLGGKPWTGRSA